MNKLEVLKNYLNYVVENKYEHNWKNTTECHCGMLLKSLSLEHLQDKRFLDININSEDYKDVNALITYLTNWIKYEEQLVQATTKEQVPVKVSVS